MINILFFFICLAASSYPQIADGIQSTLKDDLELGRQLKLINKPPVKSIHTKFGYTVDCIDINKQPAFDHPLLKNHKLQRKPSFQQTKAKASVSNSLAKSKTRLEKVLCPIGTVPIRRTTKDDLIRAKLLNTQILTQGNHVSHVAELYLIQVPGESYYGVSGANSIYNPTVIENQTSAAHIWVQNGEADGTNKIIVGWHVSPQLYGDMATYLYSSWTSDNFKKTGCYNLQCPGFVQTSKVVFGGVRVDKTSVYGGVMAEITISLSQDANTKNWWLNVGQTAIGYFPAALFSNMTSASQVGWGGETTTSMSSPIQSPPMGSGHLPDDDFSHACYFRYIAFQNDSRKDFGPEAYRVEALTDRPNCFSTKYYENVGQEFGYALQFGGPGGNCDD